jgi:hypothetical protein
MVNETVTVIETVMVIVTVIGTVMVKVTITVIVMVTITVNVMVNVKVTVTLKILPLLQLGYYFSFYNYIYFQIVSKTMGPNLKTNSFF